jgi:hypothetical protein
MARNLNLELSPDADPATLAAMRRRLADSRAELAEYRNPAPGAWYRRGYGGECKRAIRRLERWIAAVEKLQATGSTGGGTADAR